MSTKEHRGLWCSSSVFLDKQGNCRNPDGCACDAISRLERERDEALAKLGATARLALSLEVEADERIAAAESELTTLRARVERLEEALKHALDELNGLSYIHDGNPSDAMSDMPPLDYARHMLFEARQVARAAAAEARAALTEEPKS